MGSFQTTNWSLVLAARSAQDPGGRAALAELCRDYWFPLYAFVRRRTGDPEAALDLTQAFFADLLERNPLARVDPAAGTFRGFLLASIKNFMAHEREKASAQKRGGGRALLSLDADEAESRYAMEPRHDRTPEREFEFQWAMAVLDRVHQRLRGDLIEAGKEREWRALSPYLTDAGGAKPYRAVAAELDSTEAAVKMGVRRLRLRFGTLLREEIAQSVGRPDEVDRELRDLLQIVRQG